MAITREEVDPEELNDGGGEHAVTSYDIPISIVVTDGPSIPQNDRQSRQRNQRLKATTPSDTLARIIVACDSAAPPSTTAATCGQLLQMKREVTFEPHAYLLDNNVMVPDDTLIYDGPGSRTRTISVGSADTSIDIGIRQDLDSGTYLILVDITETASFATNVYKGARKVILTFI